MKLVEDWKACWKWLSVQLASVTVVAMQLYEQVPQFQQWIPDKVFHNIMTGLVALVIIGRIIKQND